MKKIISLILALVMMMSLSVTVFAAEYNFTEPGTATINVTGTYVEGEYSEDIISVDVAWGEMEFTYTDAAEGTWNPATHTYENAGTASWSAKGNTITVTNHSNVPVNAKFAFAKNEENQDIEGTFDKDALHLYRAEVGSALDSEQGEATFTISGTFDGIASSLGTITVSISKPTAA